VIRAYAVDSFTILRFVSRDPFNRATYSPLAVKGYIEWDNKLVRNVAGEEVISVAKIYLPYDFELSLEDIVEISGVKHSIAKTEKKKDFSTTHWEFYIL
jgi:hypothetical protein